MEKRLESLKIFFVAMALTVLFMGLLDLEISQEQKVVAIAIVAVYGTIAALVNIISNSPDRRYTLFLVISSGSSTGAVAWLLDYGFLAAIISVPAIVGLGYVLSKETSAEDES